MSNSYQLRLPFQYERPAPRMYPIPCPHCDARVEVWSDKVRCVGGVVPGMSDGTMIDCPACGRPIDTPGCYANAYAIRERIAARSAGR